MKTYVFAIGGTGARVLKALTMLLAAGSKKLTAADVVVPVIIDYDIENGDTNKTQKLLELYQSIHKPAYKKETETEGLFFATTMKKIKEDFYLKIDNNGQERLTLPKTVNPSSRFEIYLDPGDANATFAKQIGYDSLNDNYGTTPTQRLLQTLYDASPSNSRTAELQLNLRVGFKGCPNIGSVVMRNLKENSQELQDLLNRIDPLTDRVVIIGSVFGGTGASGIPVILDMIKKSDKGAAVKTAILAVEPYFAVAESSESAISSSTFLSKTKAALDAYAKGEVGEGVNDLADAIYYVGDNTVGRAFENSEGGVSQKNDAHIAELVSAACVIDFMLKKNFTAQKFHLFGLQGDAGMIDGKSVALNYNDFFPSSIEDFIDPLARFAIFSVYCETFLADRSKWKKNDAWIQSINIDGSYKFIEDLYAFTLQYQEWIKQMEGEMHPLKLFNFSSEGYKKLFYDLKNVDGSLFKSTVISDDFINSAINKEYDANKQQDDLSGHTGRAGYIFFKHVTAVMQKCLDKVLDATRKGK